MINYYWSDDDEQVFASPLVDHEARGKCSGIPACCIAHYLAGGSASIESRATRSYIACSTCVESGHSVDIRHCCDLKDACTCGQWAEREPA